MKNFVLLLAIVALAIQPAYTQKRTPEPAKSVDSPRQVKSGDLFPLGDDLLVKVTRSTASNFSTVKVQGEAVVVALELNAGKKGMTLSYKPSSDPRRSEIFLSDGDRRIGPRAVVEDFPSWGNDNDKEVEVLDPKEVAVGSTIDFQKKGSILLLFDLSPDQAKAAKKLSVSLRTLQPKNEQHSFVVNL